MGMDENEIQSLASKRALHGLVLTISTEGLEAAANQDLWLRTIIMLLATVSALGSGLAWRNLAKSSELQIRLVRASEMDHAPQGDESRRRRPGPRNAQPAQYHPRLGPDDLQATGTAAEIQRKSRDIIEEADKVAAQLNEFINYSRPREVRRSKLALGSVVNEVVRTLNYDLEEKHISLQIKGEQLSIEADDQLLRQALFNLVLNAIQAVDGSGEIQVVAVKRNATEAVLEVRDNGPGVPPERRTEISSLTSRPRKRHRPGPGGGPTDRARARLGDRMPRQRAPGRGLPHQPLETRRVACASWYCRHSTGEPEFVPVIVHTCFIQGAQMSQACLRPELARSLESPLAWRQADSTAPLPMGHPRSAISR